MITYVYVLLESEYMCKQNGMLVIVYRILLSLTWGLETNTKQCLLAREQEVDVFKWRIEGVTKGWIKFAKQSLSRERALHFPYMTLVHPFCGVRVHTNIKN